MLARNHALSMKKESVSGALNSDRRNRLFQRKTSNIMVLYVLQLINMMVFDLDKDICSFLVPRLHLFRNQNTTRFYRKSFKETQFILQRMIEAFETHLKFDSMFLNKKESEKIKKGLELFAKHFHELWLL